MSAQGGVELGEAAIAGAARTASAKSAHVNFVG